MEENIPFDGCHIMMIFRLFDSYGCHDVMIVAHDLVPFCEKVKLVKFSKVTGAPPIMDVAATL